jgi:hypothetical protein
MDKMCHAQSWALSIKVLIIDNYRTFLFYYAITNYRPCWCSNWFLCCCRTYCCLCSCCCPYPRVSASLESLVLLPSLLLLTSLLIVVYPIFLHPCCCWWPWRPAIVGIPAVAGALLFLASQLLLAYLLLLMALILLASLLLLALLCCWHLCCCSWPWYCWHPCCCWLLYVVGISAVAFFLAVPNVPDVAVGPATELGINTCK